MFIYLQRYTCPIPPALLLPLFWDSASCMYRVHIRTESVLNWVPDGVRCIPNNQPIECKFVVVNYPSSAILEDSKRIDIFFTRNEPFRGIPNARATKPRPRKKSKSMSTSFLPLPHQRNHYRRACVLQSKVNAFQGYHATLTFLKHRTTSRGCCIHITIIGPHRAPNLLSCASRESTWQPCTAPREYVASIFT